MGLKLPKYTKSEVWRLNWRDMNIAQIYETAQLGHTAGEVQPLTLSVQTLVPT